MDVKIIHFCSIVQSPRTDAEGNSSCSGEWKLRYTATRDEICHRFIYKCFINIVCLLIE